MPPIYDALPANRLLSQTSRIILLTFQRDLASREIVKFLRKSNQIVLTCHANAPSSLDDQDSHGPNFKTKV
jgi:hypothetical protein